MNEIIPEKGNIKITLSWANKFRELCAEESYLDSEIVSHFLDYIEEQEEKLNCKFIEQEKLVQDLYLFWRELVPSFNLESAKEIVEHSLKHPGIYHSVVFQSETQLYKIFYLSHEAFNNFKNIKKYNEEYFDAFLKRWRKVR